jgi:hypothetical protein
MEVTLFAIFLDHESAVRVVGRLSDSRVSLQGREVGPIQIHMDVVHLDSVMQGTVTLRSGSWGWNVIQLREMPSNRLERQYVFLRLEKSATSRMEFVLASVTGPSSDTVAGLARYPRRRELVDSSGELWTFYPIGRREYDGSIQLDSPCETLFRSEGGSIGGAELPPRTTLGDVTDQELLERIETHGQVLEVLGSEPMTLKAISEALEASSDPIPDSTLYSCLEQLVSVGVAGCEGGGKGHPRRWWLLD